MPPLMDCGEVRTTIKRQTRERIKALRARPVVKLYDRDGLFKAELFGEIEAEFEDILNDSGEGRILLFGDHELKRWLVDELEEEADIHITVDTPGKRWPGKAVSIDYGGEDDGFVYIELKFIHVFEVVKKAICYSNPLLPPEFQFPKMFLLAAPAIFAIKTLIFLCLLRRFAPLWSLPENIFSPSSWLANLNPANWPIVVVPGSFLGDTSMWTVLATRFGNLFDVIKPTLEDAGLHLTADLWVPGDPQPAPTHFTLIKATIVLDVKDKSGVRGPTGTAFDGLLKLGRTILADGVSETIEVLYPGAPPAQYSQPGVFGTVNEAPFVSFRTAMYTGVTGISSWHMTVHKALAGAILTGGRSPGYINAGIKFLLNGILGYIGMMFGNPGLALGIFDKTVEDVVLAFHRVGIVFRQAKMGRLQFGEHWENSGGTGFSVSALQAIRVGKHKTRAYTSFRFTVRNGAPWWIGWHFDVGDRIAAEIGDTLRLYVDQVHSTKLHWSRDEDPVYDIALGDSSAEQMPGDIFARQVESVRSYIQSLNVGV